ncbi:MAG TPA: alpha/beta hydrolase [Bryobacteraceae bacterium]|jgi:pimeloyl-ACP methyl ester carboxylesterase|nr:alpha/beta hydrolase [Bryobacteraceae bacterium]
MGAVTRITLLFALACVASAQAPPPPGKLIDVGGYRVHLNCTGAGRPTVTIVGAGYSFDWRLVQNEVAKFTRVCTYDPAGTAWSDQGPGPDCTSRVTEIHKLLANANIEGPYIVVGLSVGALTARLYAARYPESVAGMVIVDHAFLDPGTKATAPVVDSPDSPPAIVEMTPIVIIAEDDPGFRNLPENVRNLHRWAASLNPNLPSVETARKCIADVEAATGRLPQPLGDTPLTVVSTANESPNYPRLQQQLLSLSRNSRQFIADRSFHAIEMSQPEIVVAAIRAIAAF